MPRHPRFHIPLTEDLAAALWRRLWERNCVALLRAAFPEVFGVGEEA